MKQFYIILLYIGFEISTTVRSAQLPLRATVMNVRVRQSVIRASSKAKTSQSGALFTYAAFISFVQQKTGLFSGCNRRSRVTYLSGQAQTNGQRGISWSQLSGNPEIKNSDPVFMILCPKLCASMRSVETNRNRFFGGVPGRNSSFYRSALRGSRWLKTGVVKTGRGCEQKHPLFPEKLLFFSNVATPQNFPEFGKKLEISKAWYLCKHLVIPQWSSAVLKSARYHPSGFESAGCREELLSRTLFILIFPRRNSEALFLSL